MKDKYKCDIY